MRRPVAKCECLLASSLEKAVRKSFCQRVAFEFCQVLYEICHCRFPSARRSLAGEGLHEDLHGATAEAEGGLLLDVMPRGNLLGRATGAVGEGAARDVNCSVETPTHS